MEFRLQYHPKDPDQIEATYEFEFCEKMYTCLAFVFHRDTLLAENEILKALEGGEPANVEMRFAK